MGNGGKVLVARTFPTTLADSMNEFLRCWLLVTAVILVGCSRDVPETEGIEMDPVLSKLFEDSDDFRLVDALAVAIPESTSKQLPRSHQVVVSVWNSSGLIGNGGFWAFLRSDIDFDTVIDSLEEIGATESVEAMRQAVSVFPNSVPPDDWLDRGDFIDSLGQDDNEILSSASSAFYAAEKQRLESLGKYVRSNVKSFRGLKAGWVAREYVENLKPFPEANADTREIALWILGLGGHVQFPDLDGEVQFFNSLSYPLPDGDIVISEIGFPEDRSDTVALLKHVSTLTSVKGTLETISFQSCRFSSDMVPYLAEQPVLQSVDLSQTNVTDSDLAAVAQLELEELVLSGTAISDEGVGYLSIMPTLRKLELSRTQVTIECVDSLVSLPRLQSLSLPRELLTDGNLPRLVSLSSLTSLDLDRSQVTNEGLNLIAKMKNLESLTLDACSITDSGLAALAGLTQLKSLQMRYTGIGDDGLKHLESLTHLASLDLNSTKITDAGLTSVSKLSNLQRLALDSTHVGDNGLDMLSSLTKLSSLELYETGVGDIGMKTVRNFTGLTDLGLSSTQVTDTGIAELSGLIELRDFSFMETKVTDESIPTISKFLEIRRMYTSDLISPEGREMLKEALEHWNSG